MKLCSRCWVNKDLSEFYPHKTNKDKKRGSCISCWKMNNKRTPEQNYKYRAANLERFRLYDRARRSSSESKKLKAEYDLKYRSLPRRVLSEREKLLKRKFGMTLSRYEQMLKNQSGVCAICSRKEKSKSSQGGLKSLGVDHCHVTGKIRGLLCDSCNRGIGLLKDDVTVLLKAVNYIKTGGVHG